MKRIAVIFFLLFASHSAIAEYQPSIDKHPQKSIETAIPQAISLLKSKHYDKLFEQFLLPEELQKLKSKEQLEKSLEEFRDSVQPQLLLKSLELAKSKVPKFNPAITYAVYNFKVDVTDKGSRETYVTIAFRKVGGLWYLDL